RRAVQPRLHPAGTGGSVFPSRRAATSRSVIVPTRTTGARECARFDKPLLLSCSAAECRPGAGKPQGFSLSVISGLAALAEWIPMKKTVAFGLMAISAAVQANGVVPATDPLLRGNI